MAVSPSGSGTTTPAVGIHTYDENTVVDLDATPNAGWQFDNWSDDCSGTNPSTSVTMTADKSCTANFSQDQYTLTVNVVGSGSVSKNPNQATYTYGTNVQLTATADPGWTFSASWSGDLTGSTNPDTIIMDDDKTVTATFSQVPGPPPVGGMVEVWVGTASLPAQQSESAVGNHTALALALAAGVIAVAAGALYARRRWLG
jgi:uncharacterized repeat protein (TIGR02543 family)